MEHRARQCPQRPNKLTQGRARHFSHGHSLGQQWIVAMHRFLGKFTASRLSARSCRISGLCAEAVLAAILMAMPRGGLEVAAQNAAASQQKCISAVRGKVAWNRQGDKNWTPDNLRSLCESTTLIDSTIECFQKEI